MRGGTSHSGRDTTSATAASSVEPSDQRMLIRMEPPFLRSSVAKRRSATMATSEGVMATATMIRDSSTMTGVTAKITISGARTASRLPSPMPCSQVAKLLNRSDDSRTARTPSIAGCQYR